MNHPTTDVFLELHVPDFQIALDFYRILGFDVAWLDESYMVLKKGQSVINFYKGSDDIYKHPYFGQYPRETKKGYGVEIILFADNVKKFYDEIKDKVKIVAPLKLKHWGKWDFRVEDPFGFYLRISERDELVNQQEKIKNTPEVMKLKGVH